jgi:hypothetical protein
MLMRVSSGSGELLAVPADGGAAIEVLPGTAVLDFDARVARDR